MSNGDSTTRLEQMLEKSKHVLTESERTHLYARVKEQTVVSPSPYSSYFTILNTHTMLPILLIISILFGTGTTVMASDNARPGDFLFPVDTAVEKVSLALADPAKKNDIRLAQANERLAELSEIIDEAVSESRPIETLALDDIGAPEDASATNMAAFASSEEASTTPDSPAEFPTGTLTEAEADVFTDKTIVKIEVSDKKYLYASEMTTFAAIASELATKASLELAEVEKILVVEIEDRASRPEDSLVRSLDDKPRERVENALKILGLYLGDAFQNASTSADVLAKIGALEALLGERTRDLDEELRVRTWDGKDRGRFELRTEDGRVRVDVKDGEVRIREHDNDDDDSLTGTSTKSSLEIEADVFTDVTVIKVELDDEESVFTTKATTREAVIEAIQEKFDDLSEERIDAVLDLEIEDRASRPDDIEDESDDSNDDDSSGRGSDDDDDSDEDEDEDEDEDDDNSGHGGGDDDKDNSGRH